MRLDRVRRDVELLRDFLVRAALRQQCEYFVFAIADAERFAHASTQMSIRADLNLIDAYDAQIDEVERTVLKNAKINDPTTLKLLRTIPGIGKILSLVLLYEIDQIARFPEVGNFLSYSRLVRCEHESAGKKKGSGGKKIGNAHLKWAFSEAACLLARESDQAKRFLARKTKQHGKAKALGILAAQLGRAVYQMLRQKRAFDAKRFWNGEPKVGPEVKKIEVRPEGKKSKIAPEVKEKEISPEVNKPAAKPRRQAKTAARVLQA